MTLSGLMQPHDITETDADVAKLRIAQAVARCEAAKCQATLRAATITQLHNATKHNRLAFKKTIRRASK